MSIKQQGLGRQPHIMVPQRLPAKFQEIKRRAATMTHVRFDTDEDKEKADELALEELWSNFLFSDGTYGFDDNQLVALEAAGVHYTKLGRCPTRLLGEAS